MNCAGCLGKKSIRSPRLLTALAALAVLAVAPPAAAHRLNLTTTDLAWQPDTQVLDVTHRLHIDDALTLLAQLGAADGVLDLEASARLLNYVESQFALRSKTGVLRLEPWGAHIQGNHLFIYQRVALASAPTALEVRNELLHDLPEPMRNRVNLRVGDVVRSHEGQADAAVGWLIVTQPE